MADSDLSVLKNLDVSRLSYEQLKSLQLTLEGYDERPVSIEEFILSDYYLYNYFRNDGFRSYWMDVLKEIYPNPGYSDKFLIVLRGSIGRGKSTASIVGMLYDIYCLQCMTRPQYEFRLVSNERITFAFLNATLGLGDAVLMSKFDGMVSLSPYFQNLLNTTKRAKLPTKFPKNIDIFSGSRVVHTLGVSIYCALLSEVAFGIVKDQMTSIFNSIIARQASRFTDGGTVAGRTWIDSSESDTNSELNKIADKYKGRKGVYIDTGPLWETKPNDYSDGNIFYLYTGSEVSLPEIIDINSNDLPVLEKEPDSIVIIPQVHRQTFEADIDQAIRDLLGRPTASKYRLFRNISKLYPAMIYTPLWDDVISIDFENMDDLIQNKCKIPEYFQNLPHKASPRFIHLDMSTSGDKFGVACTFISGTKEVTSGYDPFTLVASTSSMISTVTEFAFSIKAKPGQQIPFYKVRLFMDWLREMGMSISIISTDSFQSDGIRQDLTMMGFKTEIISVDRTSDPYISFRNAVYEGRCVLPDNKLLRKELEHLEVSPDGLKVDHPDTFIDGGEGSKDTSDAICSTVYSANMHSDHFRITQIAEMPLEVDLISDKIMTPIKELWKEQDQRIPDVYEERLKQQEKDYETVLARKRGIKAPSPYDELTKYISK